MTEHEDSKSWSATFDAREVPSMGDPTFVDSRVRAMFDEARKILFEACNPQAEVPGLIDRWTKEFSPRNPAYVQILSPVALSTFLRQRGCGTDDSPEDTDAPVAALLAHTIGRFAEAAIAFHEERIDGEQLQFAIDTAVEDCMMLLRGLDNPAD